MIYALTRIITLYQAALLLFTLLPLLGVTNRPWVVWLGKVCEPALFVGRKVMSFFSRGRRFSFDFSPLIAIVLLSILSFILSRL